MIAIIPSILCSILFFNKGLIANIRQEITTLDVSRVLGHEVSLYIWGRGFYSSMKSILPHHMGVSINGEFPSSLDGLFHGKSQSKLDDLVVPLF